MLFGARFIVYLTYVVTGNYSVLIPVFQASATTRQGDFIVRSAGRGSGAV